jgi:3-dehydroquinate dehydratase type I
MKINYCLPIIRKSKKEVLEMINNNLNEYQYFEVWLDPITDLDKPFIQDILELLNERLIVLFQRGKNEYKRIDKDIKRKLLSHLNNTNVLIDLDISESDEIKYIKENKLNLKTIISYHNYDKTPEDLLEIVTHMETINPTIYKISTFCNTEHDALKLLELQLILKQKNKRYIVLGMGKFGTITRVYGTLWGNEIIYAPKTKDEASAPGQLTKQELEKILRILVPNP